ncbi:uncharacterized protein Z519_00285 [Cladophialophora bantiana CBS 173.52]|uniref:Uncharacterized protein n=1 Tax=Cladophialophora bantiana (strain ATCC 10958 / CBS 173.52 / CDC B-1940 / NIH 8579) TaxID=1442370 RepID=A0A0D2IPC7_CLAB1|nr:uncharacterized protein Z519_00285 [Cladophialophora bantiana CBS 173.52]KIW98624.1 hypothetical protein Z519_00285 [Cladophialophora bantiana CBS 173.52]
MSSPHSLSMSKEPRLGKYRRALVNLLPAFLVEKEEQLKFAEECLDIINIIRQDNGGDVSDDPEKIEALAQDFVEKLKGEADDRALSTAMVKTLSSTSLTAASPPVTRKKPRGPGEAEAGEVKQSIGEADVADLVRLADGTVGRVIGSPESKPRLELVGNASREEDSLQKMAAFTIERMFRDVSYKPSCRSCNAQMNHL